MSTKGTKRAYQNPDYNMELNEMGDMNNTASHQGCTWKNCNDVNCTRPWHRQYVKTDVVYKLRPAMVSIGLMELIFGMSMFLVLATCSEKFDRLYGCDPNSDCLITALTFGGLIAIAISGVMLLVSVLRNKRALMWFYVVASTFLCIYIFILAILMIQSALYNAPFMRPEWNEHQNTSEMPVNETATQPPQDRLLPPEVESQYEPESADSSFLLGKAFIVGIMTLVGSVVHFIGTVTVFTYYNLKYIHPMLFYCHHESTM